MHREVSSFQPNWASAPGDTIADLLRSKNLSTHELTDALGVPHETSVALLQGRSPITLAFARRLEAFLGGSVVFWVNRDLQYREAIERLQNTERKWLTELPVGDLIRFGWITPAPHPSEELQACLRFFDVPNVSVWRSKYAGIHALAAFRTSSAFTSTPGAVAAWLRKGEIEAEAIECAEWNRSLFLDALPSLRGLTRLKDPSVFLPKIREICASCGVAFVIVRAPVGCRASGATRFLSPQKAVLQLSFRFLSDDQFWFSFFHEAGHLVLHGIDKEFVEVEGAPVTDNETEANKFAAKILVPDEFRPEFLSLSRSHESVIKFSRKIGITPGIVVGQLQHLGRIPRDHLNGLKRRYRWDGDSPIIHETP
jgi:plasmid maintenance system antidote protein VapI